eukprot:1193994-Prorocentrum_minimum.AAC.7
MASTLSVDCALASCEQGARHATSPVKWLIKGLTVGSHLCLSSGARDGAAPKPKRINKRINK